MAKATASLCGRQQVISTLKIPENVIAVNRLGLELEHSLQNSWTAPRNAPVHKSKLVHVYLKSKLVHVYLSKENFQTLTHPPYIPTLSFCCCCFVCFCLSFCLFVSVSTFKEEPLRIETPLPFSALIRRFAVCEAHPRKDCEPTCEAHPRKDCEPTCEPHPRKDCEPTCEPCRCSRNLLGK